MALKNRRTFAVASSLGVALAFALISQACLLTERSALPVDGGAGGTGGSGAGGLDGGASPTSAAAGGSSGSSSTSPGFSDGGDRAEASSSAPSGSGGASSPPSEAGLEGGAGTTSTGGAGDAGGQSLSEDAGDATAADAAQGPCAPNPCSNGATCEEQEDGGVACQCPTGFDGPLCEHNIDDCPANACDNGGTCIDGVHAYACQCDSRHNGPRCQFTAFRLVGLAFNSDPTQVIALSTDGTVALVAADSTANGGNGALMVDLGDLNVLDLSSLKANDRAVQAMSGDATVIVGQAENEDLWKPFVLRSNAATYLPTPAGSTGNAKAVSSDGSTVVGTWTDDAFVTHAFRYTVETSAFEYIGTLDSENHAMEALAASGDGAQIAGTTIGSQSLPVAAWVWHASTGQTTTLELPTNAVTPYVSGMSSDGKLAVGSVTITSVSHAIRWATDTGTPEDLGPGALYATNRDGSVSVGINAKSEAAVWIAGHAAQPVASILGSNPDLDTASLTSASTVSGDGTTVGGVALVDGAYQGWVAHLP